MLNEFIERITVNQVLFLHRKAINRYGGIHSVRDLGLLESALAIDYFLDDYSISEIAGLLAYKICRNHPFQDGNKRVAFLSSCLFLKENNHKYIGRPKDAQYLIENIAKSKCTKEDVMAHYSTFAIARK